MKTFNQFINEGKISYKRKYTESYPSKNVYSNNKIKSKIIQTIADGKITNEELNNLLKELNANPRWFSRNSNLFKVNEDGIELSSTGKKILNRAYPKPQTLSEKSTSISQQRLMGQAYALHTGKIKLKDLDPDYKDKILSLSKGMTGKQLKDFAMTSHSNLPATKSESFIPSFEKFLYESNMVNHAQRELELAGMFDDDKEDPIICSYNKLIANSVIELMSAFSKQGHSGMSASMVRDIFSKLTKWETLTPITSDTSEWLDTCEMGTDKPKTLWQNKRNPAVFSKDAGKTWYNVDESILGFVQACLESLMLNPGMNVVGMGAVKFPGNAGTTTAFHGQNIGSGDVPMFLFNPMDKKNDEEDEEKRIKRLKKLKKKSE